MHTVGVIANPASGKDIRRLVAQGRFVPNQEKVNTLKRILAGIASSGSVHVAIMPDSAFISKSAVNDGVPGITTTFIDMPVYDNESDSTTAARIMSQMNVTCIVTLGGDGTNRAVAKGLSGEIPIVPISTGTNNVFPTMIEGTLAGMAAGVVACGQIDPRLFTHRSKLLEVHSEGRFSDIALVDVAVSNERFVGSRAIWDPMTLHELFLTQAKPASIGLASIGAQLRPVDSEACEGLHALLGKTKFSTRVIAPIAPGIIMPVDIAEWRTIKLDESIPLKVAPCTLALDGERTLSLAANHDVYITLTNSGPLVISIEKVLHHAALLGLFRK